MLQFEILTCRLKDCLISDHKIELKIQQAPYRFKAKVYKLLFFSNKCTLTTIIFAMIFHQFLNGSAT